ncbi:hypothetical protein GCM10008015_30310 [Flavobacterium palustre]|uniref:Fibronectin type-III domain-containing protein n=1 Tax=Flavobacterium palustre TaxID=1476463 RepID=A0ABQ1HRV5_9FLAO|nr:fibronectin type III domain-containing protein [Flavobacterium palustre]GGA87612.1 hypothetical protein GCM10008015_30310 [Flavobacterium palustre]
MRKYIYSGFISFLLLSCSGSDDTLKTVKNTAPTVPTLVAPINNKLCIDNTVSLEWNASTDAQKDPITYQLQIATDNQFTQIVKTDESSLPIQTASLSKGIAYYWRVKATDSNNASSNYSSTYSFYTEAVAVTNHLPFMPQLVLPEFDATISGTTAALSWTASDVDTNDALTYDVFLGTVNSPTTKVGNNITATSLNTSALLPATTYYWKVVVKDNKGGETIGQIWSFKTNL